MSDLIWARDRVTGKKGQHEASFLDAWPSDYFRLSESEIPKPKPSVRAASSAPANGANPEGGA